MGVGNLATVAVLFRVKRVGLRYGHLLPAIPENALLAPDACGLLFRQVSSYCNSCCPSNDRLSLPRNTVTYKHGSFDGLQPRENPAAVAQMGESSPTSDQVHSRRAIENLVEDRPVEGVREIPIPRREHGYKNFESAVIANDEALGDFLKLVAAQPNWNNKEAFVNSLKSAKIDFSSSALLLIRNTSGSGSIKVSLARQYEKATIFCFTLHGTFPAASRWIWRTIVLP